MRILILLFLLITTAQAQDLEFFIDDSGQVSSSRYMEILDEYGEIQFDLSGSGSEDGAKLNGIYVQLYGSGQCNGENALVFITNKDRLLMLSDNKVNCNGLAYFPMNDEARRVLRNYRIGNIIFYNGRNRHPIDNIKRGKVQQKDIFYFVELFYAIDNEVFSNKR